MSPRPTAALAWITAASLHAAPALALRAGPAGRTPGRSGPAPDEEPAPFLVCVEGKYGYIDRDGKVVIEPTFLEAHQFSDGLARVVPADGDRYGYIDKKARFVIKPRFAVARDFSGGYAWVYVDGSSADEGGKWGVMSKSGRTVIKPVFPYSGTPFSDEVSTVMRDDLVRIRRQRHGSREGGMAHRTTSYGVIGWSGNVVREFDHDCLIGPFSEGLAVIRVRSKTVRDEVRDVRDLSGYIDNEGRTVIRAKFEAAEPFSEGLAAVELGNKYGYINRKGEFAIRPQYRKARPFHDGLAAVRLAKQHGAPAGWGYIDRRGKLVIRPKPWLRAGPFSEGLATVILGRKPKEGRIVTEVGVIDKRGRVKFKMEDCHISPFRGGLARVRANSSERNGPLSGYVDVNGKYVWKLSGVTEEPAPRAEKGPDLFVISVGLHYGYMDRKGKVVIKPTFTYVVGSGSDPDKGEFSEGLAAVCTGYGKCGYIDKTGKYVIKRSLWSVRSFHCGRAAVRLTEDNKRWGYMDRTGKVVIRPRFVLTEDFSEGLAWVKVERYRVHGAGEPGTWGLIDKSGEMIVEPVYSSAGSPFSGGLSTASRGYADYVVIDSHGNIVVEPGYGTHVGRFSEGLAWCGGVYLDATCRPAFNVKPSAHRRAVNNFSEGLAVFGTGYVDRRGRLVIPQAFHQAEPFSEGLAAVRVGKMEKPREDARHVAHWTYIDKRGRPVMNSMLLREARPFSEGFATVVLEERVEGGYVTCKSGVIDKKGRLLFERDRCDIFPFKKGLARVRTIEGPVDNTPFGYIDTTGKFVWEVQN